MTFTKKELVEDYLYINGFKGSEENIKTIMEKTPCIPDIIPEEMTYGVDDLIEKVIFENEDDMTWIPEAEFVVKLHRYIRKKHPTLSEEEIEELEDETGMEIMDANRAYDDIKNGFSRFYEEYLKEEANEDAKKLLEMLRNITLVAA